MYCELSATCSLKYKSRFCENKIKERFNNPLEIKSLSAFNSQTKTCEIALAEQIKVLSNRQRQSPSTSLAIRHLFFCFLIPVDVVPYLQLRLHRQIKYKLNSERTLSVPGVLDCLRQCSIVF